MIHSEWKLYISEDQFTSKEEIWNAILDTIQSILYVEIEQFTKSTKEKHQKLILEHGEYISHLCFLYNNNTVSRSFRSQPFG